MKFLFNGLPLLLAIMILFLGLVPIRASATEGVSGYFKYSIDVTFDNEPYSYSQYIKCVKVIQPSEGPQGLLYLRSEIKGGGWVAERLDATHTLLFSVQSTCMSQSPSDLSLPVGILETGEKLTKLYLVKGQANTPSVSVNRIRLEPVESATDSVGPSKERARFTKTVLAQQSRVFGSVTARRIPYEIWATSDHATAYFNQFSSVAIAQAGEAPPISGRADNFVQFPFYRERAYPRINGQVTGLEESAFDYNGTAFILAGQKPKNVEAFYASSGMTDPQQVIVDFKGSIVKVSGIQEVYDPETKVIYSLQKKSAGSLELLLNTFANNVSSGL